MRDKRIVTFAAPLRGKQIYWHKQQKSIFYCDDDKRRTEVWRHGKSEYLLIKKPNEFRRTKKIKTNDRERHTQQIFRIL